MAITPGEHSGRAVSLNSEGDIVAIGAPGQIVGSEPKIIGRVRIYQYDVVWDKLGTDIVGSEVGDMFGDSVSISSDGKTVAVGGWGHDNYKGLVRVYYFDEIFKLCLVTYIFIIILN